MTDGTAVAPETAAAFEQVRAMLQADGADLVLRGIEEGRASAELILTPETCQECIVPTAILEGIILQTLQEQDPAIATVDLDDPRRNDAAHA